MVTDCGIERREESLVSRYQHDQMAARPQMRNGAMELVFVVHDMFENVDIEDAVEQILRCQVRDLANEDVTEPNNLAALERPDDHRGERWIRLERQPLVAGAIAQASGHGANAGPHLKHAPAKVGPDEALPTGAPVFSAAENLKLGPHISERIWDSFHQTKMLPASVGIKQ